MFRLHHPADEPPTGCKATLDEPVIGQNLH